MKVPQCPKKQTQAIPIQSHFKANLNPPARVRGGRADEVRSAEIKPNPTESDQIKVNPIFEIWMARASFFLCHSDSIT
jgi:hypothetical protein